uniref:Transmembrane protein n=1 Tax=Steinernema glaseri TaxID=37863 RepID=A0A1I8AN43_9BILA
MMEMLVFGAPFLDSGLRGSMSCGSMKKREIIQVVLTLVITTVIVISGSWMYYTSDREDTSKPC